MLFDQLANMVIGSSGGGRAVFGSKPGVAEFTPTDLGTESKRAAQENLANAPEIAALLEKILPGYSEMVKQGSANTLSLLKGEIPQDVKDAVYRSGAYKALSGGYGGSGMSKALTARDLGLTSLDLTGRGENSAQRWAGLTQSSNAPFLVTGKEQAAQTERNNLYQQAVQQFKYNVDAAPDPAAAGLFNLTSAIGSTAASFGIGSALGGMGGGGGGGNAAAARASAPAYAYAYPAPTYNWGSNYTQGMGGYGG